MAVSFVRTYMLLAVFPTYCTTAGLVLTNPYTTPLPMGKGLVMYHSLIPLREMNSYDLIVSYFIILT